MLDSPCMKSAAAKTILRSGASMPLVLAEQRFPLFVEFIRGQAASPPAGAPPPCQTTHGPQPLVLSPGQAPSASALVQASMRVPPQAASTRPSGTAPPVARNTSAAASQQMAEKLAFAAPSMRDHGAPQRSEQPTGSPAQSRSQCSTSVVTFGELRWFTRMMRTPAPRVAASARMADELKTASMGSSRLLWPPQRNTSPKAASAIVATPPPEPPTVTTTVTFTRGACSPSASSHAPSPSAVVASGGAAPSTETLTGARGGADPGAPHRRAPWRASTMPSPQAPPHSCGGGAAPDASTVAVAKRAAAAQARDRILTQTDRVLQQDVPT